MSNLALTDLPDRSEFLTALKTCLDPDEGTTGLVGLIIIKVQRLRDINLELGYQEGDTILHELAQRIHDCLRQSDVMARIGTSEFALILPGLRSQGQPLMAVNKIMRACEQGFEIQRREFRARLSFGVSLSPQDADDATQLLRCADLALGHARKTSKPVMSYTDCAGEPALSRIEMEGDLETAIRGGDLEAHYQPIINVNSGELVGVEKLARWNNPTHGAVLPEVFVEMAERSGLIMPLTLWSLNTALRECSEWQPVLPNISVAVNLSANVLTEPDLPELVLRGLAGLGCPDRTVDPGCHRECDDG